MSNNNKRKIKLFVKGAISLLLLLAVYRKVSANQLYTTIQSLHLTTLVLITALYLGGQLLSTLKWYFIVSEAGIKRSWSELFRAYFFGMFINAFAFGTVGGDVARSVAIKPERGQRILAFASVAADRIHGLSVLITIGTIFLIIAPLPHLSQTWTYGAVLTTCCCWGGWFIGPPAISKLLPANHSRLPLLRSIFAAFPRRIPAFALITTLSCLFHSLQISIYLMLARDLHTPLGISQLYAAIPFVNAASTLPISIQGIGIREKMFDLLLVPAGLSPESAVTLGAVWLAVVTAVSAVGGLILTPELIVGRAAEEITKDGEELATDVAPEWDGELSNS